jgi:hypothetical protein
MTRQDGDRINPEYLRQGSPTNSTHVENIPRWAISGDLSALTTQVMLSVAVPLQAGDVVSNITFLSGATALATGTNWWFALYSSASTPALLAQTADQTSTAWAADTAMTVALSSAQLITAAGLYYASIMVKAGTLPSLMGRSLNRAGASGAIASGQKILARTSGSSLTDTAPATITSATTVANVPYVVLT